MKFGFLKGFVHVRNGTTNYQNRFGAKFYQIIIVVYNYSLKKNSFILILF
jgi:hypothetical protein